MNHMIHNLTPTPDATSTSPTTSTSSRPGRRPTRASATSTTVWIDVEAGRSIPSSTSTRAPGGARPPLHVPATSRRRPMRARRDQVDGPARTACSSAPRATCTRAGCGPTCRLTRDGRTVRLFRSKAKYFEPAGAVSWDVAMTATPENWRVGVQARATCCRSRRPTTRGAPPGTSRWGSCPSRSTPAARARTRSPRTSTCPARSRTATCAENRNHGGAFGGLPDARRLLSAPPAPSRTVPVSGFLYGQGDLGMTGRKGRPPTIRPGQSLRFVNRDAKRNIFHTITSCKAPCNGATGIAYPLANGPVRFDSGNLGFGPAGPHRGGPADLLADPEDDPPRHLHVLLPRAPVHARARSGSPAGGVAGESRRCAEVRPGPLHERGAGRPVHRVGASRGRRSPSTAVDVRARRGRRAAPSARRPGGRSPRAAQRHADVAVVAPGGAGRDEDPLRRRAPRRAPAPTARRSRATAAGPVPGGKARSVPASTAARCSRSAAASARRRGR